GNKYEDTYGNPIEPKACGANTDKMRINADVAYIGQQSLKDNGNGTWSVGDVITQPNQGVFAENPSLTNLTMGSKIVGIGDFAFKGCSTLSSVDFGPSLRTIGNGAFAECIRLTSCNIASNANIRALGKDAFYQCRTLTSFTTNIGLEAIGDSCFEECIALSSFYFADGGEVALKVMGNHVFRGCSGLAGIEFPASYSESTPLEIDMFEGCTNLQYVRMNNDNLDFDVFHKDTPASYPRCTANNWDRFKDTVPDEFYFEGRDASAIHQTCKDNSVAFKYYDEDRYERKVYEIDKQDQTDGKDASGNYSRSAPVTYQINSQGQILSVAIEKRAAVAKDADGNWYYTGGSTSAQAHPVNLTIPEKIGPFGIDTIGDRAFENNCYITKVTIPATVSSIGSRAFAGCHNLETVIFTDATAVANIGTDAFKTQDGVYDVVNESGVSKIKCGICKDYYTHRGNKKDDLPELTFCGAMLNTATNQDTVPFVYAMNGQSNINNSDQITSWIKYHSGWPTNLVVQYDYDAISGEGEVTLVDYPRYTSYTDSYGVDHYGYKDDPDKFVESLPYIDKDDDPDKYQNYLDLVTGAVTAYQNYKADPKTNPAPTEQQMTLINSALN
ncbi:MAG: leucine-rich repeat protein, partial [Lachnospiraceae bacterium]|nr:leucine-rich repeat protein [Lachnospiraceae bacterium]